jgi:hypothetical protein
MPFDGVEAPIGYVAKLDQVIDLIESPGKWVKHAYRTPSGRYCLKEALNVVGVAELFEPIILKAAAEVMERDFCCIESFNDHPLTTRDDVVATLQVTRANIIAGKTTLPPAGALHPITAWHAHQVPSIDDRPPLWRKLLCWG